MPAGNIASITAHPGTITAVKTLHRRLFIFSQNFCEVWENAGFADFPLRRNNSLLMEFGTISKPSVLSAFDRLFFLSNTKDGFGHIMMVSGTQAVPISNQALDSEIQTYATIVDAYAMCYQTNGIIFFRLNFTTASKTWVFNATQSTPQDLRWHEEQMLDGTRNIGQIAVFYNETNYFLSYKNCRLYEVSELFLTNDGETI